MSYDVSIHVASGTHAAVTAYDTNMTSNVARMWREAGCDIAEFNDKPAIDLAISLHHAITAMEEDPEKFRAMEPGNGWGDYGTTLRWLAELKGACLTHNFGTVSVSR